MVSSFWYTIAVWGTLNEFASQQGWQFLGNSEHWYGGGTFHFKVCHKLFFSCIQCMPNMIGKYFQALLLYFQIKQKLHIRFFRELFDQTNVLGNGPADSC